MLFKTWNLKQNVFKKWDAKYDLNKRKQSWLKLWVFNLYSIINPQMVNNFKFVESKYFL